MKLFHGSGIIFESPKIINRSNKIDFGSGFYATDNYSIAEKWARQKIEYTSLRKCFVYEFEITNFRNLKILDFVSTKDLIGWFVYCCINRQIEITSSRIPKIEFREYDIIIGDIMDNAYFDRIKLFKEFGSVDILGLINSIRMRREGSQYCFKSNKSLESLELISIHHVSKKSNNSYDSLDKDVMSWT